MCSNLSKQSCTTDADGLNVPLNENKLNPGKSHGGIILNSYLNFFKYGIIGK